MRLIKKNKSNEEAMTDQNKQISTSLNQTHKIAELLQAVFVSVGEHRFSI